MGEILEELDGIGEFLSQTPSSLDPEYLTDISMPCTESPVDSVDMATSRFFSGQSSDSRGSPDGNMLWSKGRWFASLALARYPPAS